MKKLLLISLALMMSGMAFAQKYACVDTEYILDKIPSYKTAQEQIESTSTSYQKEVETAYKNLDAMFNKYQAEKAMLSSAQQKKREDEIVTKEKATKALQQSYFGKDGVVFKKQEELIKPIQEKVFNAIKSYAEENGYTMIFDLSNNSSIVYLNDRTNVSDKILERLGY